MSISRPVLACHYWSIYYLDIEQACSWAKRAGYGGIDLGSGDLGDGARLDPAALARDPDVARRFAAASKRSGTVFTDLFLALPYAANDPDPDRQRENLDLLKGVAAHAPEAGIPLITVSPGFTGDAPWRDGFDRSVDALQAWVTVGERMGVPIAVEAHIDSVADTPDRVEALMNAVPGLGLTLDYSHFIAGGHDQRSVEPLHRYASHVHVRQCRPGVLAAPVDEGIIDFRRVLTLLRQDDYAGAITVEYVSSPWRGQDLVDSAMENEAMRQVASALIDEIWGGAHA